MMMQDTLIKSENCNQLPACRMSGNLTSIQHNNYQTQTTVSSQLCCMAQSVGECVLHLSKYHASFLYLDLDLMM